MHGRKEKQPKKKHKWSCRAFILAGTRGQKNEEVGRDGWGDHTGLFRGMSAKKRGVTQLPVPLAKVRRQNLGSNAKKTPKPANSNDANQIN